MKKLKITAVAGTVALIGGAAFALNSLPSASQASEMTVYKSESCGCCGGWVDHMREARYAIRVVSTDDRAPAKIMHDVPEDLWGCHTAVIDGRVIEGHVPAAGVSAFLKSSTKAKGIAVAGMPLGSPGMEAPGATLHAYDAMAFGAGQPTRFMTFRGSTPLGS